SMTTSKAAWCPRAMRLRFTDARGDEPALCAGSERRVGMITRRSFTAGAATLLAAGHISTRARAATASWDMSTVWPDGNFHTQNAFAFAEEVKKQTGGGVAIAVKAGGQLGFKGPEHL